MFSPIVVAILATSVFVATFLLCLRLLWYLFTRHDTEPRRRRSVPEMELDVEQGLEYECHYNTEAKANRLLSGIDTLQQREFEAKTECCICFDESERRYIVTKLCEHTDKYCKSCLVRHMMRCVKIGAIFSCPLCRQAIVRGNNQFPENAEEQTTGDYSEEEDDNYSEDDNEYSEDYYEEDDYSEDYDEDDEEDDRDYSEGDDEEEDSGSEDGTQVCNCAMDPFAMADFQLDRLFLEDTPA